MKKKSETTTATSVPKPVPQKSVATPSERKSKNVDVNRPPPLMPSSQFPNNSGINPKVSGKGNTNQKPNPRGGEGGKRANEGRNTAAQRPKIYCYNCKQWAYHVKTDCRLGPAQIAKLTPMNPYISPDSGNISGSGSTVNIVVNHMPGMNVVKSKSQQ